MKARSAVIAIALLLLLLAAGCLHKKDPPKPLMPNPIANPPLAGPQATADKNVILDPVVAAEVDKCEKIANKFESEACITKTAFDKLDTSPCERLSLLSRDECIMPIALGKKDTQLCQKISELRKVNSCLRIVGMATKSFVTCQLIKTSDPENLDTCVNSVARADSNSEQCFWLSTTLQRDSCLLFVASQKKDTTICGQITNAYDGSTHIRDKCYIASDSGHKGETCLLYLGEAGRAGCFFGATNTPPAGFDCSRFLDKPTVSNCNYWLGTRTPKTSYCYLVDGDLSKTCLDYIVSHTPQIDTCLVIKDYKQRNVCIKSAAIDVNSSDYCELITTEGRVRDHCLMQVGIKSLDQNTCFKIARNDINATDNCIAGIAFALKEPGRCELIQGDLAYPPCYSAIAINYKSPDICKLAVRSQFALLPYAGKEYCYRDYAVNTNDKFICDKISVPDLKNQCRCGFAGGETCGQGLACPDQNKMADYGDRCCQKPTTGSQCLFVGE